MLLQVSDLLGIELHPKLLVPGLAWNPNMCKSSPSSDIFGSQAWSVNTFLWLYGALRTNRLFSAPTQRVYKFCQSLATPFQHLVIRSLDTERLLGDILHIPKGICHT
jgi:hypothetical protein